MITQNTSLLYALWRYGIFEQPFPFGIMIIPQTGKTYKLSIHDFELGDSGELIFSERFLNRNIPLGDAQGWLDMYLNPPTPSPSLSTSSNSFEPSDTLGSFLRNIEKEKESLDKEETALERYKRIIHES